MSASPECRERFRSSRNRYLDFAKPSNLRRLAPPRKACPGQKALLTPEISDLIHANSVRVLGLPSRREPESRMAQATFYLADLDEHALPPVCVRCGAAATQVKEEKLTYVPLWGQLAILCVLFQILPIVVYSTWTVWIGLPYCRKHARSWPLASKIAVGVAFLGLVVLLVGLYLSLFMKVEGGESVFGVGLAVICVTGLIAFLAGDPGARATEITAETVTLDRVSQEFVDALANWAVLTTDAPAADESCEGRIQLQTAKYYRDR
jgi:hypothetical protein